MNKTSGSLPSKKILRIISVVGFIIILIWGIQWATYARPPLPVAIEALENDSLVTVTSEPWLTFSPGQSNPTTGFIFYPGGRIDPQGYAPLMRTMAAEGYLIVVPEMPLNMAVFNPNIAGEITAYYSNINDWVIGGHSVGGTMAAQFTAKNPESIDGLAIWASYPADSADISDLDIPVVSIYGSLDPRVNAISVAERQELLPPHTDYVQIDGGDHHQFGAYEITLEEHHATISQEAQYQQITEATLALLSKVNQ